MTNSARLTVEDLTTLLMEGEASHAMHEKQLGRRDKNWAAWYASFIVERLKAEADSRGDADGTPS